MGEPAPERGATCLLSSPPQGSQPWTHHPTYPLCKCLRGTPQGNCGHSKPLGQAGVLGVIADTVSAHPNPLPLSRHGWKPSAAFFARELSPTTGASWKQSFTSDLQGRCMTSFAASPRGRDGSEMYLLGCPGEFYHGSELQGPTGLTHLITHPFSVSLPFLIHFPAPGVTTCPNPPLTSVCLSTPTQR